MERRNSYDDIDEELSKTFFGSSQKPGIKKIQLEDTPVKDDVKKNAPRPPAPKKSMTKYTPITVVILLLVSLACMLGVRSQTDHGSAGLRKLSAAYPFSERLSSPLDAKILFDFERDKDGWEIPVWAKEKTDHVAKSVQNIYGIASHGNGSLEINTDFPAWAWSAALVEISQFIDVGHFDTISVDIFLPNDCPKGLRGKMILTVGEDWRFTEMSHSVRLEPGKWTRVEAKIYGKNSDWRNTVTDENFRKDIRKIAVRVESDKRPSYSGPVFIDNIMFYNSGS